MFCEYIQVINKGSVVRRVGGPVETACNQCPNFANFSFATKFSSEKCVSVSGPISHSGIDYFYVVIRWCSTGRTISSFSLAKQSSRNKSVMFSLVKFLENRGNTVRCSAYQC